MPSRRTPLARVTPLGQGEARLARGVPLKRAPRERKAARDTGPSRKVRALVLARDGYRCCGCGISVTGRPYSLQHRVARGMGGTSRPDVNSPVNLLVLCGLSSTPGSCHLACEQRDPVMHERGLWLRSTEDPALVPVMITSEHGSGMTVWLTPGGGHAFGPPAERAA